MDNYIINNKENDSEQIGSKEIIRENRAWVVGSVVWASTEDILSRVVAIISYGLGTGFSQALKGTTQLFWWLILLILIIIVIRVIIWFVFGVDKHEVPLNIVQGNTYGDEEWYSYIYMTMEFYENIALWLFGGLVTDWVVNIENNGRFIPAQYGLPVLVIPIFLTIIKKMFKTRREAELIYSHSKLA